MNDFKDHILYVVMTCAVLGCATALTITGHLNGEAVIGLLGAVIPTGIGLGRHVATTDAAPDDTQDAATTGGNGQL